MAHNTDIYAPPRTETNAGLWWQKRINTMTQQREKLALDIVEELNGDVEERGGLEHYRPFEFRAYGYMTSAILFMGIVIWTEENDERDYIGETDEKEPLRSFIIKQAEIILKDLNMKMGAF